MTIKSLILLAFLAQGALLSAKDNTLPTNLPDSSPFFKDSCSLPAPTNFHVQAVGPTWVTLAWDNPPTPRDHRIRIFRQSDNFLLSTTTVSAGTSDATIQIPFNTGVYAVINAICLDGSHSPNIASTTPPGVIIDLIVDAYQGSNSQPSCSIIGNGTCTFGNSGYTTFKISLNGQYPMMFDVQRTIDGNNLKYFMRLQRENSGNNNTFSFYCHTVAPPCTTALVKVTFWQNGIETIVGYIDVYQSTTVSTLQGALYNYNGTYCKIERLGPAGLSTDPPAKFLRERDGKDTKGTSQFATATPNPFSEELEVFLTQNAKEKVHLQLYNLSGQKVLDQTFQGGLEQYSLSTAGLSPGFYMLRIEADGVVQTFKVIKSE